MRAETVVDNFLNENMTYIDKLKNQLIIIEPMVDEMLNNSSIFYNNPNEDSNGFYFVGIDFNHWLKKDEKGQIQCKESYDKFYQNFQLLLEKATPDIKEKIVKANLEIRNLIEQDHAPVSIEKGKTFLRENTKILNDFLELLRKDECEILIVPDTNALIQYPDPLKYETIAKSKKFSLIILPTVLSELDKLKINHRNEDFRKKVNSVIKRLKGYRKQGDILQGVIVNKTITLKMIATEPNFSNTLIWLDSNNNDDRIIANGLELQTKNASRRLIFVSSDINFQNKAEMANLEIFDPDDFE